MAMVKKMTGMKMAMAASLCSLMLTAMAGAVVAPVPVHVSPGPGWDMQFLGTEGAGGFDPTDLGGPSVYGERGPIFGSPTVSAGEANFGTGDVVRYTSTLENDVPPTLTAMSPSQDWVFETKFRQTGDHGSDNIFVVKNVDGPDERIVLVRSTGTGSTDDWEIEVGSTSGGGFVDLVTGLVLGDTQHTLTVHYKSSSSTMDIYWDGALQAGGDTTLAHGLYAPQFIQLQGLPGAGTVHFDSVVLAQVVPEPATIALLGFAGIFALKRRDPGSVHHRL